MVAAADVRGVPATLLDEAADRFATAAWYAAEEEDGGGDAAYAAAYDAYVDAWWEVGDDAYDARDR